MYIQNKQDYFNNKINEIPAMFILFPQSENRKHTLSLIFCIDCGLNHGRGVKIEKTGRIIKAYAEHLDIY